MKHGIIIGYLTFIISAIALYLGIKTDAVSLTVERTNETLISEVLDIASLSKYFDDSVPIDKLWQTVYLIRNTGGQTILGEGFTGKNLRADFLSLSFGNCKKILSCRISDQNCKATLEDKNKLVISQWKPNEFIEITILSEGESAATISIDDRQIANSDIIYTVSKKEPVSGARLIDKFSPRTGMIISFGYWLLLAALSLLSYWLFLKHRENYLRELERKSKSKYYWCLVLQSIAVMLPQALFFLWI